MPGGRETGRAAGWVDPPVRAVDGTHPAFGTPPERGFEASSVGKSVTYAYPELRLEQTSGGQGVKGLAVPQPPRFGT